MPESHRIWTNNGYRNIQIFTAADLAILEERLSKCCDSQPEPPPAVLAWPPSSIPLTWSVNWTNAPARFSQAQMLNAMRRVFREYTQAPGELSFREVRAGGELSIRFGKVDGRGGTLAFVFQPASGLNMAACGGQCGDYMFDNEEVMSIIDFENVFRHETGHAIGAGHFASGVMKATYRFGTRRTVLDPLILAHIATGYPALT